MSRGSNQFHRFASVWAEVHGVDLASLSDKGRIRYIERLRLSHRLFRIVSEFAGVRNPNRLKAVRYRELAVLTARLKRALEPARLGNLLLENGAFRGDVLLKAAAFVANAYREPPGLDDACRRLRGSFTHGNLHFLNKFSMEKLRTFDQAEFVVGTVPTGWGAGTRQSTVTYFDDYYPFIHYLRTGQLLRECDSSSKFAEAERGLRAGIIETLRVTVAKRAVDHSLLEEAYSAAKLELVETALTPDCGYLYQASLFQYMLPVCQNILHKKLKEAGHERRVAARPPGEEAVDPLDSIPAPAEPSVQEDLELLAVYNESFQLVLSTFEHPALVKAVWVGMILEKCGYGHLSDDWVIRYSNMTYALEPTPSALWQTRRRLRQRLNAVVRNRRRRVLGEPATCSFQVLMMAAHAITTMDAQAVSPFLQIAALECAAQNDLTLAWVTLAAMLHRGMSPKHAAERTFQTLRLSAALGAIVQDKAGWDARTAAIIDRYGLDRDTIKAEELRLRRIKTGVKLFGRDVNLAFVALPLWYLCDVCHLPLGEALELLDLDEFGQFENVWKSRPPGKAGLAGGRP